MDIGKKNDLGPIQMQFSFLYLLFQAHTKKKEASTVLSELKIWWTLNYVMYVMHTKLTTK
jgi:hypothetical protein